MPRRGRPSKLVPEVETKLLDALRAGSHYKLACQYAGIDYTTFTKWMQIGRGEHPTKRPIKECVELVEKIKEATAQGELTCIADIKKASKQDWRAAAWLLERRYPEHWTATHKVRVEVEKQVNEEINLLFEAIHEDDEIPVSIKQKIYQAAVSVQQRAEKAPSN